MSDYPEGKAARLTDLAMQVAGGIDLGHLQGILGDAIDVKAVKRIFSKEGLPWKRIVESDVLAVLSGHLPEYFLSEQKWVQVYRSRRNISVPPPTNGAMMSWEDSFEYFEKVQARRRQQIIEYGVTDDYFEMGYACFEEQQYFYGTREWQNRAKAARLVAGYQCKRCGVRDVPLEVHHQAPIVSAYHHNFDSNFADYRLEALCQACHTEVHEHGIRGTASYCFVRADPERVAVYKAELRKLTQLHQRRSNCPFCSNRIAERYPNP